MTPPVAPLLCVANADLHEVRALASRLKAVRAVLPEWEFGGAQPAFGVPAVGGLVNSYASWAPSGGPQDGWVQHKVSESAQGLVATWTFQPPILVCSPFGIAEPVRTDRANMPDDDAPLVSRLRALSLLIDAIDATADALADAWTGPRESVLRPVAVARPCERAWTSLDQLARHNEPTMTCHEIVVGQPYVQPRATLLRGSGRRGVRSEIAARTAAGVPPTGLLSRTTVGEETWTIRPLVLNAVQFDHLPEPYPTEALAAIRPIADGSHPAKRPA